MLEIYNNRVFIAARREGCKHSSADPPPFDGDKQQPSLSLLPVPPDVIYIYTNSIQK